MFKISGTLIAFLDPTTRARCYKRNRLHRTAMYLIIMLTLFTRMLLGISENRFDNNPVQWWNFFLGYDAQTFAWNALYFPIYVFFSTIQMKPVLVALSLSFWRPINELALSGTVGSLLTFTTQFGRGAHF